MATASIRLDRGLVEKASIMGKALNRTPPKQIEYWAKIGEMMEDNLALFLPNGALSEPIFVALSW